MINDEFWIRNYEVENKLAELRRERGLSQRELGDILGLSASAISTIERGAAIPTIRLANVLALFFEVPVDEIFIFRRKQ